MVHRAVLLANILAIASAKPLSHRQAATLQSNVLAAANSTSVPDSVITTPVVPAAATATPTDTITTIAASPATGNGTAPDTPPPASGAPLPIASATVTAAGVSVPSLAPTEGSKNDANPDAYTFFKGDGKVGWPTRDQWISFDEMFKRNSEVMGQGCPANVTSNTPEDNDNIKKAILDIAPVAGVDPRFALAIVMQESNGCVRVQGTPSGQADVFNPGLMQSFKGSGTCNVGNTKQLNPCPIDQVTQMIIDGVQGTIQENKAQAGLVEQLDDVGGDANGQVYYVAARAYNSGKVPDKKALESAGQCGPPRTFGVPCYSSDIANRLLGWVKGATKCDLKPAAKC